MGFDLQITPTAKIQVKEAVVFYRQKASAKIAKNFLKDYEKALQTIKLNPYFQIYYKNFRGLPLKKFPFILIFSVDEKAGLITINAVFQSSQNPEKYP